MPRKNSYASGSQETQGQTQLPRSSHRLPATTIQLITVKSVRSCNKTILLYYSDNQNVEPTQSKHYILKARLDRAPEEPYLVGDTHVHSWVLELSEL